jgi:hypothetical protein
MSVSPLNNDTLPTELGEALRHFERAQSSQASLSDIIPDGQDELVNVLGVIVGVAAASSDQRLVIAAGLAGYFSGALFSAPATPWRQQGEAIPPLLHLTTSA